MSENPTHPLTGETVAAVPSHDDAQSIVDTMFKLDAFMSGDVRRARKAAIWYARADLEARLDELDEELSQLLDSQGRPRTVIDRAVGDGTRSADVVMSEREDVAAEMHASRQVMYMEQVDEDDWAALIAKHKETLAGEPPFTAEFYEDVITASALTEPKMTVEHLRELRKRVGRPVFDRLFSTAWDVNTRSGVSVPKSLLSSGVLRQQQLG